MTFEEALSVLTTKHIVETDGEMLFVRLRGKTGSAKLAKLMQVVAGFCPPHRDPGEALDPTLWALAMGASVLVTRRADILVFLDGSTTTLPTRSGEPCDLRNPPTPTQGTSP